MRTGPILLALLTATAFAEGPSTPGEIRAYFASAEYRKARPTDGAFIDDVYRVILRRAPDEKGRRDWLAALKKLGRAQVLEGFLKSREYLLLSAPKPRLAGAEEARGYFKSKEYKRLDRSDEGFLFDVYQLILGRSPDEKGFKDWLKALRTGKPPLSRIEVVARFLRSDEYTKAHPGAKPPKPTDTPDPPGGDKKRIPGNAVFDGLGLFVEDGARCTVKSCGAGDAEKFKAAGVRWIALQIHNNAEVPKNAALMPGWLEEWRQAGFKAGFWGVSYGKGAAAGDARTAARLTARYRADFYIANCEHAFQWTPDGSTDPGENKAFVDAFQAEASALGIGAVPRALSSMGRVALDMKPWLDDGWDTLPQAYWNDHQVYQPSLCCRYWRESGWPAARIHPTIATYGATGDQTRKITLPEYAADLKACGTRGVSYYLPENYLDAEQLGQLGVLR